MTGDPLLVWADEIDSVAYLDFTRRIMGPGFVLQPWQEDWLLGYEPQIPGDRGQPA